MSAHCNVPAKPETLPRDGRRTCRCRSMAKPQSSASLPAAFGKNAAPNLPQWFSRGEVSFCGEIHPFGVKVISTLAQRGAFPALGRGNPYPKIELVHSIQRQGPTSTITTR